MTEENFSGDINSSTNRNASSLVSLTEKSLNSFITESIQQFTSNKKAENIAATRTPPSVVVNRTYEEFSQRPYVAMNSRPTKYNSGVVSGSGRDKNNGGGGGGGGEPYDDSDLRGLLDALEKALKVLEVLFEEFKNTITEELGNLTEQLQKLVNDLLDFGKSLILIDGRVTALETKFTKLEAKVNDMDSYLTTLDENLRKLGYRVMYIESRLNEASISATCQSGSVEVTLNL